MRNESEVLGLILDFLKKDANLKAAVLNGSRANPNAPRDFMQDYDVAVFAADLEAAKKYIADQNWVAGFGDLVILQFNAIEDGTFIFLLQYDDSVRIDLGFHDVRDLSRDLEADSLSVVLYDRDNLAGPIPPPSERTYFVAKPTEHKWDETLNELWWLQVYIAKELWRDELPLAKELYDIWLMNCLRDLVSWHIGEERDWQVNVGHGGKWFKRLLPSALYQSYVACYCGADPGAQWDTLLNLGAFIRAVALPLSKKLGYEYPTEYDANVSAYIRRVYALAPNAEALPESDAQ